MPQIKYAVRSVGDDTRFLAGFGMTPEYSHTKVLLFDSPEAAQQAAADVFLRLNPEGKKKATAQLVQVTISDQESI